MLMTIHNLCFSLLLFLLHLNSNLQFLLPKFSHDFNFHSNLPDNYIPWDLKAVRHDQAWYLIVWRAKLFSPFYCEAGRGSWTWDCLCLLHGACKLSSCTDHISPPTTRGRRLGWEKLWEDGAFWAEPIHIHIQYAIFHESPILIQKS